MINMTYHFAVCDDEPAQQRNLERMIQKWSAENGLYAHITCFSSAEAFLFSYAEDKTYDILLLDIEMAEMNGVQLARIVRSENKEIQIIFITGYMEYIADGYDVEALHFLIKPVTETKLFEVLGRAVIKLYRNDRAVILNHNGEAVRIPLYEIRFIDVQRNYVTVHANEDIKVKATLSELERELDDAFLRIGRSFIVHLNYIRRVTKTDILLSDGTVIPLPRGQYDKVNRALIDRL